METIHIFFKYRRMLRNGPTRNVTQNLTDVKQNSIIIIAFMMNMLSDR